MSLPVIIVYELPERNVSQQHIKQRRNDSKTHDSLACNGRAISSELLISWDFIRYCPRRLNNTQKGSNQTKEKYIHTHTNLAAASQPSNSLQHCRLPPYSPAFVWSQRHFSSYARDSFAIALVSWRWPAGWSELDRGPPRDRGPARVSSTQN